MNCVHGNEHLKVQRATKTGNRKIHNEICAYIYPYCGGIGGACGHNTAPIQLASGAAVAGVWYHWILTAVTFLVISCPCAMVISVPLAFFLGIGSASKKGILFKSGFAVEGLRKIKIVELDKTGTITRGIVEDTGLLDVEDSDDSAKPSESFKGGICEEKGIRG